MNTDAALESGAPSPEEGAVDVRMRPGTDAGPLVRGLLGGLAGVMAMLASDALLPGPLALPASPNAAAVQVRISWAALAGAAVAGDPHAQAAGIAALCAAGALAGLVYAFGRFRRFVPARPWLRGVVWGAALGVVVAPLLLPAAAPFLPATPLGALAGATQLVGEVGLGLVIYGALVGLLNPPPE